MIRRPDFPAHIEKEQPMSLLSIELSQVRIREAEREVTHVVQVRAVRRARRDAETTAVRLRRVTMG